MEDFTEEEPQVSRSATTHNLINEETVPLGGRVASVEGRVI